MIDKIILAGNGHGAIVAYKSLLHVFETIEVLTDDEELISSLRHKDKKIEKFEVSDAKYAVCAGYKKIIGSDILAHKTIINTHPSLLPKYRGLHALAWAMLNRETELGFTIHLMNEYIDDGDILAQFKLNYNGQTSKEVMDEFDSYVLLNLGKIVKHYIDGQISPKPQNRELATWVPKRNLSDCLIDFKSDNESLIAVFKTFVPPYPLPQIIVSGEFWGVCKHSILLRDYYTTIGRVVNIENDTAYVKFKDGLLLIHRIKNTITGSEIPASNILRIGQRLV